MIDLTQVHFPDPTGRGCVAPIDANGRVLGATDPSVPGPSCEAIDEANKELKPTVTVAGGQTGGGDFDWPALAAGVGHHGLSELTCPQYLYQQ